MKMIRLFCFAIIAVGLAGVPAGGPVDGEALIGAGATISPTPVEIGDSTSCATAPARPLENNGGATHTKLPSGLCDGIADDC